MPRYKLKPGHKHYHLGKRYEGRVPGHKASESGYPDVLELDEERAERIMNKLIPLGAGSETQAPEEEAPDPKSEEVSAVASDDAEQAQDDSDKEEEAPASDSDNPEDNPEDESPLLSAVHRGSGKWDVMRGDKPLNDAPLTEDEAKALADQGNE